MSESDYLKRQLEENLVFDNDGWFRHETIKDYLQRRMPPTLCKQYHLFAAKFFELRMKERRETGTVHTSRAWMNLLLSQDYHLRCAGQGGQGLLTNEELFTKIVFEDPWEPRSLENILSKVALLEKLYDYSQYVGDRLLEAAVLLWLGRVKDSQSWLYPSGSPARTKLWTEARQLYDKSLGFARSLPDRKLIAEILGALAFTEWHYKNYDAAIRLMKESFNYRPSPRACRSLEQIQETGDIARCLSNLSELEYLAGNIGAAARHCKRYLRLIVKVKNAQRDWERANMSFETFNYAVEIVYGLYLLGQLYEACKENRKAIIIYGLLEKCYPDFRAYKGDKTVTELLDHLKGKVGQRRFKRYRNEVAELGFVAHKNLGASVYQVMDIVNDTLLRIRRIVP